MHILAFDTCFGACSAAVAVSGGTAGTARVIAARFERMDKGHAERLIPMIDEVMTEAGTGFAGLERIAVTVGPGTFTGIRIGIAAARALALASGVKVAGTTSLNLLAHQVRARIAADSDPMIRSEGKPVLATGGPAGDIAIAIDARRDEIYFQLFDCEALRPLTGPLLITPENAAALLRSGATVVAGSGASLLAEASRGKGLAFPPQYADEQPDARVLAQMSGLDILDPPLPLYLRAPDAKPQDGKALARAP